MAGCSRGAVRPAPSHPETTDARASVNQVEAAKWPAWLHAHYMCPELGAANVAWLCYFVCDPTVHAEVAENVLRTAFTTMPEIDAVRVYYTTILGYCYTSVPYHTHHTMPTYHTHHTIPTIPYRAQVLLALPLGLHPFSPLKDVFDPLEPKARQWSSSVL